MVDAQFFKRLFLVKVEIYLLLVGVSGNCGVILKNFINNSKDWKLKVFRFGLNSPI